MYSILEKINAIPLLERIKILQEQAKINLLEKKTSQASAAHDAVKAVADNTKPVALTLFSPNNELSTQVSLHQGRKKIKKRIHIFK